MAVSAVDGDQSSVHERAIESETEVSDVGVIGDSEESRCRENKKQSNVLVRERETV